MAETVTIDGKEYATADFSDKARAALVHFQLVEQKIVQNKQELAILQTARSAYAMSLKRELPTTEQ